MSDASVGSHRCAADVQALSRRSRCHRGPRPLLELCLDVRRSGAVRKLLEVLLGEPSGVIAVALLGGHVDLARERIFGEIPARRQGPVHCERLLGASKVVDLRELVAEHPRGDGRIGIGAVLAHDAAQRHERPITLARPARDVYQGHQLVGRRIAQRFIEATARLERSERLGVLPFIGEPLPLCWRRGCDRSRLRGLSGWIRRNGINATRDRRAPTLPEARRIVRRGR